MIELCAELGVIYLDTVTEPWEGGYTDASLSMAERTNYAMRNGIVEPELRARLAREQPAWRTTAVTVHGANPGLVSHFVKQGLLDIARDTGFALAPGFVEPSSRQEWASLARALGVQVQSCAATPS